MTKPDIGTPDAAVRACVALIASVTGQPEELTERYLDLYYQTRRAAEAETARDKLLADLMAVPGELAPLTLETPEAPKADTSSGAAAPPSPQGEGREKPKAKKKVDFEEVLASASAGAKLPSKPKNAPYWKIKAEIRDRFIALRAQGMTIAQTVNLSGGKVTENQILNIMNGSKVGMDAYNAIEEAMDKWEATVKAAGQAESTTE